MSSNWRPAFQPEHLSFITTKAVDYAHVFQRELIKRLLLDTFDSFRLQKRWCLFCFVIMPNHLHWIAQFLADDPFDDVLRDYKKQTADRIIRPLKAEENEQALAWLAAAHRKAICGRVPAFITPTSRVLSRLMTCASLG